jgi:hypothetical protein
MDIWPEAFKHGDISFITTREQACATMMKGWALCLCGHKPPYPQFGEVLAALSMKFNLPCTPEGLSMAAKEMS